ncbi:MAG TPA: class I SAM-dependent methyltransferase [Bacilli bacterium]|nr:class I SAM-dependent methyltransferase [Bacilli bacterium]
MKSYNNLKPLAYYEELEPKEIAIYQEQYFDRNDLVITKELNIKAIKQRALTTFKDYDYNLPQNIFVIKQFHGQTIVGRKIRSSLRIENKINAINCSMITAPMLLGILSKRKKTKRQIVINFFPFTNEEKQIVFDEIKINRQFDIYYPYKYRDYATNQEEKSPAEGWTFNPDKKEYLGYGEVHLRKFTNTFLLNHKIDLNHKIIYDPACSTGEFLSSIKQIFPESYTIGHDLSAQMIAYAQNYVDEAGCYNAAFSPLAANSVDVLFLRFLNSEVVTTKAAYEIFKTLKAKVKKGGLIIAFGHTPVLITKAWLEKQGLKTINCNGYDEEADAIFQYYGFEVSS